jgi:hypothetical protein
MTFLRTSSLLVCCSFMMLDAEAQTHGVIRGYVGVRDSGTRLAGVAVYLDGHIVDRTNDIGFFKLPSVPPGRHTLELRLIGFKPRGVEIVVAPGDVTELLLGMEFFAITLEPIVVDGRWLPGRLADVARRARASLGDYIWRDEIEKRRITRLTDALIRSPKVRLAYSAEGSEWIASRWTTTVRMGMGFRQCTPAIYLDGARYWLMPGEEIDGLIGAQHVEVIEVYRGIETPGEFGGGLEACGAIVIWSRRGG